MLTFRDLKNLPVHPSMLEVSELIYETCKTYLRTQGKFILVLWLFIAVIMVVYFGFLSTPAQEATGAVAASRAAAHAAAHVVSTARSVTHYSTPARVIIILLFSLIGIGGSYFVASFGIRINTFANSRTALASLAGRAYPVYSIPLKAGMS